MRVETNCGLSLRLAKSRNAASFQRHNGLRPTVWLDKTLEENLRADPEQIYGFAEPIFVLVD
jgi:hypothetical protein